MAIDSHIKTNEKDEWSRARKTALTRKIVHEIPRGQNEEGRPYASDSDQLREYVETELASGAEFVDMGASTIGMNRHFTDAQRARLLSHLDAAITVVRDRALENSVGEQQTAELPERDA